MLAAAEKTMKLRDRNPFFVCFCICITSWYQMTSDYPPHLCSEKIWDSAVRWCRCCCGLCSSSWISGWWSLELLQNKYALILISWNVLENSDEQGLSGLLIWVSPTGAFTQWCGNMWNTLLNLSSYLCGTWLKNCRFDHCLQRNRPQVKWFECLITHNNSWIYCVCCRNLHYKGSVNANVS